MFKAFSGLLLLGLVPAFLHADEPAASSLPYTRTENVIYADVHGIGLLMDIFVPTGPKNGLAVIDVISGSFHSDRGKFKQHEMARMFRTFTEAGYTVFAIRPGSITKFSLAEMAENLKRGIQWVKFHAPEYGIDPDRLGMVGASAGGHLCSLVALTPEDAIANSRDPMKRFDTRVRAAVAFFPPTDFLRYGKQELDPAANDALPIFLSRMVAPEGTPIMNRRQMIDQLEKVSPARRVTKDAPPFLIVHGDADPVVPIQQSELLVEALQKEGIPVRFVIKPGGAHPWLTIHEEVKIACDWITEQLEPTTAVSATSEETTPAPTAVGD